MAKYKIRVDRDECMGDQRCGDVAPRTFHLDDEGKAAVLDPEGDPPERILSAANECRMEAIRIQDAATGKDVEVGEELRASFEGPEVLDRVLREHAALRDSVRDLNRTLEDASRAGDADQIRAWAGGLATSLRGLRGELEDHFQREQGGGLFSELRNEYPRATGRIDALRTEHDQMLGDLQTVLTSADERAAGSGAGEGGLYEQVAGLLGRLAYHEATETELISQLLNEDLGGSD